MEFNHAEHRRTNVGNVQSWRKHTHTLMKKAKPVKLFGLKAISHIYENDDLWEQSRVCMVRAIPLRRLSRLLLLKSVSPSHYEIITRVHILILMKLVSYPTQNSQQKVITNHLRKKKVMHRYTYLVRIMFHD